MTAPTITPLPQDPQKSQGVKLFNINAKAWTAALSLFTTQINALVSWLNASVGFAVIVNDSSENYILLDDDRGVYRRMTNTEPKVIIVNTSAESSPMLWSFRNVGFEPMEFNPADGVTITPNAGGSLSVPQNGTVSLLRVGINQYELTGQTVAA